jgi:nucleotide-binding universal stress UspA family protein
MYHAILIAVDGSAISDRALQEGIALARDQQAQLRVVHVVDTMPVVTGDAYVDFDGYRAARLDEARDALAHVTAVIVAAGSTVEPTLVTGEGVSAADAILNEATRWSADLIVIGTHGRGGLRRLLMGSVAEGIVRHAPVPVLLMHAIDGD